MSEKDENALRGLKMPCIAYVENAADQRREPLGVVKELSWYVFNIFVVVENILLFYNN